MKKVWIILIIVALILIALYIYLFLGPKQSDTSNQVEKGTEGTNTLVVYFTRSNVINADKVDATTSASVNVNNERHMGNTEIPARMIADITGADLYAIKTSRQYRNAFMGTASTAFIEEKLNLRPKLADKPENLDQYDVIYVGYPIWWFNAPMAVGTFLESYDLSGKTIIPFCTSEDNGIDVSMDYIRKVSGNAKVLDGIRFKSNMADEKTISEWVSSHSEYATGNK